MSVIYGSPVRKREITPSVPCPCSLYGMWSPSSRRVNYKYERELADRPDLTYCSPCPHQCEVVKSRTRSEPLRKKGAKNKHRLSAPSFRWDVTSRPRCNDRKVFYSVTSNPDYANKGYHTERNCHNRRHLSLKKSGISLESTSSNGSTESTDVLCSCGKRYCRSFLQNDYDSNNMPGGKPNLKLYWRSSRSSQRTPTDATYEKIGYNLLSKKEVSWDDRLETKSSTDFNTLKREWSLRAIQDIRSGPTKVRRYSVTIDNEYLDTKDSSDSAEMQEWGVTEHELDDRRMCRGQKRSNLNVDDHLTTGGGKGKSKFRVDCAYERSASDMDLRNVQRKRSREYACATERGNKRGDACDAYTSGKVDECMENNFLDSFMTYPERTTDPKTCFNETERLNENCWDEKDVCEEVECKLECNEENASKHSMKPAMRMRMSGVKESEQQPCDENSEDTETNGSSLSTGSCILLVLLFLICLTVAFQLWCRQNLLNRGYSQAF